jgi:integrator complex subunit 11
MDIKIFPLGAGQEVGRSCLIITINGYKIMLDCGVHMGYNDERKFPEFQRLLKKFKKSLNNEEKDASNNSNTNDRYNSTNNNTNNISNNNTYKFVDPKNAKDYTNIVDLLIISHFHLDHCGALPFFTELLGYKGPILCSQPTKAILPVTLEDFRKVMSEYKGQISILRPEQIKNCVAKIQTIEINETRVFNKDIKVTCFYAGHVLGACMFLIDVNGNRVTYTGDCNTIIDRHLSGAYMPKIYPDVLMTETTYGDKVRETKRIREREFLKKIEETLSKGGKVLIPIFALGRAQELCILIDTYWKRTNNKAPIYFIGPMAQKVNFYYKLFQNWMNPAVKNAFTQRNVFDFKFVQQSDKSLILLN